MFKGYKLLSNFGNPKSIEIGRDVLPLKCCKDMIRIRVFGIRKP
jgi:hypothetical protein